MHKTFTLFLLMLVVAIGCTKKDGAKKDGESQKTGPTLVTVNGSPISLDDYQAKFQRSSRYNPEKYQEMAGKEELLKDLVDFELLFQEAKKQNLADSEQIKRMMVRALMRKEVDQTPTIGDEELKSFYDAHPDEFVELRASHILFKTKVPPDKMGQISDADFVQQQRVKAEAVLKDVKAGKDFAELAKKNSEDTTAQNGGDLGYFTSQRMVKPFADAAFALKNIGDTSEIVETRNGFHIIKLTDRRNQDFTRARMIIKNKIMKEKRKAAYENFVAKLRKDAKIVTEDKAVKEELGKLTPSNPQQAPAPEEMGNPLQSEPPHQNH